MSLVYVVYDNEFNSILGVFESEMQAKNAIVELAIDEDENNLIDEYAEYLNDFAHRLAAVHPTSSPSNFTYWFLHEREEMISYTNGSDHRFSVFCHTLNELNEGQEI